jgi:hypothetical protein
MSKKKRVIPKKRPQRLVVPLAKHTVLTVGQTRGFIKVVDMMTLAANRIAGEIVAQITLTIEASGKQVAPGSFDLWYPELVQSVLNNLVGMAVWNAPTQGAVLGVAADMGAIAVILAGDSSQVARSQIHAAFNAVSQSHSGCAAASGGQGGGTWCNFEM